MKGEFRSELLTFLNNPQQPWQNLAWLRTAGEEILKQYCAALLEVD